MSKWTIWHSLNCLTVIKYYFSMELEFHHTFLFLVPIWLNIPYLINIIGLYVEKTLFMANFIKKHFVTAQCEHHIVDRKRENVVMTMLEIGNVNSRQWSSLTYLNSCSFLHIQIFAVFCCNSFFFVLIKWSKDLLDHLFLKIDRLR